MTFLAPLCKKLIQVAACKEVPNYESTCFSYCKNKKGATFIVHSVEPSLQINRATMHYNVKCALTVWFITKQLLAI